MCNFAIAWLYVQLFFFWIKKKPRIETILQLLCVMWDHKCNFIRLKTIKVSERLGSSLISSNCDYIIWCMFFFNKLLLYDLLNGKGERYKVCLIMCGLRQGESMPRELIEVHNNAYFLINLYIKQNFCTYYNLVLWYNENLESKHIKLMRASSFWEI